MKQFVLSSILCLGFCYSVHAQSLYFPPVNGSSEWETESPASLGWCQDKIDTLYQYLNQDNTKGFIMLKNGKIVLEKYFGTFTADSLWYWASAGKTLTAFLIGKAQEDQLLTTDELSSKYLGNGWTSFSPEQEDQIKIVNQLTMTSGLDDGVADNHCTLPACLQYMSAAGTRWAYHNAPYTLLEKVVETASGLPVNTYTQLKLKNPTGITGTWIKVDFDNVFFSKVRSMARYGLLVQNNFVWNTDTLLYDTAYPQRMVNSSQSFNPAYGYLWWLNGKDSYMLPTSQYVFPGFLAPNAPADMIAGLGKNGQILSIAKSKGIVFVRMGNQSGSMEVANQLCDQIWAKLNAVMCNENSVAEENPLPAVRLYPNPAGTEISVLGVGTKNALVDVFSLQGQLLISSQILLKIDISGLAKGIYLLRVTDGDTTRLLKFIKQ